jgi:Ca2+/Na+ antiporter
VAVGPGFFIPLLVLGCILAGGYAVVRSAAQLVRLGAHPIVAGGILALLSNVPELAAILAPRATSLTESMTDRGTMQLLGFAHHIPVGVILGSAVINVLLIAGLGAILIPSGAIRIRPLTLFRDATILVVIAAFIYANFFWPLPLRPDDQSHTFDATYGLRLLILGAIYVVFVFVWDFLTDPSRGLRSGGPNGSGATQSQADTPDADRERPKRRSADVDIGDFILSFLVGALLLFAGFYFGLKEFYPAGRAPLFPIPLSTVATLLPVIVASPELLTSVWAVTNRSSLLHHNESLSIDVLLSSSIINLTIILGLAAILVSDRVTINLADARSAATLSIGQFVSGNSEIESADAALDLIQRCVPLDPKGNLAPPTGDMVVGDYCAGSRRKSLRYMDLSEIPKVPGLLFDKSHFWKEALFLLAGSGLLWVFLLTDRFKLVRNEGIWLVLVFLVYAAIRYGPFLKSNEGATDSKSHACQEEVGGSKLCERYLRGPRQ